MPNEKERQEPESPPPSPEPKTDRDLESGEGGTFEVPGKPADD
jgi:hypothetical protein